MDINEVTRKATNLAKSGDLNAAIDLLKIAIDKMQAVGGYSNNGYTKIIPYFQKAGRYKEAIDFSFNHLIPAVSADCKISFQHKCSEIQEAFTELSKYQIFDKLRLNSKREGIKADEEKFDNLSKLHFTNYQKLLALGSERQLKVDFEESINIFGSNFSGWPDVLQKKYASLISNT